MGSAGATGRPHSSQNLAAARSGVPHAAHARGSAAPQFSQNFAAARLLCPHAVHVTRPLYAVRAPPLTIPSGASQSTARDARALIDAQRSSTTDTIVSRFLDLAASQPDALAYVEKG